MKTITKIEAEKQEKKKLKVAAYCRVSTGMDDQLESLDAQKQHYEQVIRSNDEWAGVGIYYDEGITGTKKDKRPELLRLLRDCKEGRVDLVLTKSISRFARNTTDCLEMVRSLSACGVGIFFESENINTLTMEDEFVLTVLGSLAENESMSISENEKWSIQKRFMKGTFKQGIAPYGYYMEHGVMKIDTEKADIVHFIFDEASAGKGAYKIAKELNAEGIPSLLTDHWNVSVIQNMLRNERYIGDVLYQKTYSDNNFVRYTNRGECDQYLHRNHHEAIISREQFERVQTLIEMHRKEKNISPDTNYQKRYAFSGKLICEECGGHLKRKKVQGRVSGQYIAWECQTHVQDKNQCSLKVIPEDVITAAFVTVTNKLIFSRKELLVPFVKSIQGSGTGDVGKKIEEINRKLEENSGKAQTMAALAADNLLEPTAYRAAQTELAAERAELNSEKSVLGIQIRDSFTGVSEGGKLLKRISQMQISKKFDEDFFSEFVKAVHVYSREELGFEFSCGLIFREAVKAI